MHAPQCRVVLQIGYRATQTVKSLDDLSSLGRMQWLTWSHSRPREGGLNGMPGRLARPSRRKPGLGRTARPPLLGRCTSPRPFAPPERLASSTDAFATLRSTGIAGGNFGCIYARPCPLGFDPPSPSSNPSYRAPFRPWSERHKLGHHLLAFHDTSCPDCHRPPTNYEPPQAGPAALREC